MDEYRKEMCAGRDAAQDAYDKAILSGAGGGLAVALGFVKTTGAPVWPWLVAAACLFFTTSLVGVIYSFRSSRKSFDVQLAALDNQVDPDRIYREKPGGVAARRTEFLNVAVFACLLLGIGALTAFVVHNLGR